jgi:YgiT-type zinc finger domain-containing protein
MEHCSLCNIVAERIIIPSYTFQYGENDSVTVHNLPVMKCNQCGEMFLNYEGEAVKDAAVIAKRKNCHE